MNKHRDLFCIFFCCILIAVFPFSVNAQTFISVDSLISRAAMERRNGSFDVALQYDLGALVIAKSNGDIKHVAAAYNGIATDYYRTNEFRKARIYYNKSLEQYAIIPDTINVADQYYKLGMLDIDESRFNTAARNLSTAKKIFQQQEYYPGLADVYNAYASLFYVQGNLDSVAWYAQNALEFYKLADNHDAESFMYINLGALENARGNHRKALELVQIGIEVADSSGLVNQLRQGYKNLSETHAMMGNWESAYKSQIEYIRYKDSIFSQQSEKALMEVETRYQTAEKERKIQEQKTDLLEKENKIEAFRNTRNLLLLLLLVTAVAVLFFIYRFHARKKINRLLDEKNRQLEDINAYKDKLFAIISHDLRSPVSSFSRITSALNMAIDKLQPQEIKKYLSDIDASANELQHMLRGLLHWSLTQQGGVNVVASSVLVSDCVNEAISDCHGVINEKQIHVITDIPQGALVLADARLLQIVLRNVLSNAVKFSKQGSDIRILTICENSQLVIDICDHGPGVPAEIASGLFGKMAPGSPSDGSGFGLFMSSELLRKMNGNIHLAATSPDGSIFRISLPTAN